MYRVLVVDNSLLSSAVISYRLGAGMFEVECCPSHYVFEERLNTHRPHLIVYNLDMPQHALAGYCAHIRRPGSFGDAKVLVVSDSDEACLMEMVEVGFADGYFRKSLTMDGLADAATHMIEGN